MRPPSTPIDADTAPTGEAKSALSVLPATEEVTPSVLLQQIVENSADAIFCQDQAGLVTTWNPGAQRIYGYSSAEIVGLSVDVLVPDWTREQLVATQKAALGGDRVERFDTWHLRKDGTLIPVNVSASPLLDRRGTVIAMATTVADISLRAQLTIDLERIHEQLARQNLTLTQSNRDLEQFAYIASHDLSEPLRVMSGYVAQLERRYDAVLDERGRRYMKHIVDASARMRALIDDLLEYSRFLKPVRERSEVDLGHVFDRVVRSLETPLRDSGAVVERGELPVCWSDNKHAESLMLNLVSNAIKFSKADQTPHVSVTSTSADGWHTLIVDDNGIGVPVDYRDRVFRMFQRLHVREDYEGTGIGLAIAQQIVELHGGRIWIEDSPLGGARFCCTLPAVDSGDRNNG